MVPTEFVWQVAECGHRWVEIPLSFGGPHTGRFLTHGHPFLTGGARVSAYRPLADCSGLFRIFSETETSEQGIAAFADRYGLLGGDMTSHIPLLDQPRGEGFAIGPGERFDLCRFEIERMRFAVELWEAARTSDVDALGRVIFWSDDGSSVRCDSHPHLEPGVLPEPLAFASRAVIASTTLNSELMRRLVPGDLSRPALYRVQSIFNEVLAKRGATPRMLWDPDHQHLGLHLWPSGLLGALWLQFASAVARDAAFRRCAECSTWFEVATSGGARADKLYCSNTCRTKVYRRRQSDAVRLHGEGLSTEAIATRLDAAPHVVAGWIARGGPPPAPAGKRRRGRPRRS